MDKEKFFKILETQLEKEKIHPDFLLLVEDSLSRVIDFINNDSFGVYFGYIKESEIKNIFMNSAIESTKKANESYARSFNPEFDEEMFLKDFGYKMQRNGLPMVGMTMIEKFIKSDEYITTASSSKSAAKNEINYDEENISAISNPPKSITYTDSRELDKSSKKENTKS